MTVRGVGAGRGGVGGEVGGGGGGTIAGQRPSRLVGFYSFEFRSFISFYAVY